MPISEIDQEKARQKEESRLGRQVAFAAGIFQNDVTISTILASPAEGLVIIDDTGTILLINLAAEKMFGYQMEDLVSKPLALLVPERSRKVYEKLMVQFFAEPGTIYEIPDLVGLRRNGSELDKGATFYFTLSAN